MNIAGALHQVHEQLGELQAAAEKLPNQNFADILKGGRARLAQLLEHPDLDKVAAQLEADMHAGQDAFPGTEKHD